MSIRFGVNREACEAKPDGSWVMAWATFASSVAVAKGVWFGGRLAPFELYHMPVSVARVPIDHPSGWLEKRSGCLDKALLVGFEGIE
jgi:hypothetical protein